ncbi:MAG: hypothetical protein SFW67_01970 [Myxococcaceae bacterium]|nr:hypothetical protein [Myxococcaceae bacterium]
MLAQAFIVAQTPCEPSWPRVAVLVSGEGLLPSVEPATRAELEYEVRQAGFCPARSTEGAAAVARIEWPAQGAIALSISATSGQTVRQLSRSLDVSTTPPDGWPLAVGASLGELLQEARRELPALRGPETPDVPVGWGIGLGVSGEVFSGGQTHGGLELFGRVPLVRRLTLEPSVMFRLGLVASAPSGEVTSSLLGGALHGVFDLVSFGRFVLAAVAGVRVGLLRLEGRAREPAMGTSVSSWIVVARAGLELRLLRAPLLTFVRLVAGAPLAGAAATEAGARITAVSGVEGGATVAIGGAW